MAGDIGGFIGGTIGILILARSTFALIVGMAQLTRLLVKWGFWLLRILAIKLFDVLKKASPLLNRGARILMGFTVLPVVGIITTAWKRTSDCISVCSGYLKDGYKKFTSFSEYRDHFKKEKIREIIQSVDGYASAQRVLGFSGEEPQSLTVLKTRYKKLIQMLHSDKGWPTDIFAQMVNDSYSLIKRTRGWK